ncbi:hypothetical protein N9H77_00010 [Porticoccaceae bacterium]|nr:hypothetical protein [Porticoccaceae bacterium]
MKYIPLFILYPMIALIPFKRADNYEILSNGVIRGDGYVQFKDGGKLWMCGTMADGTIDAALDAVATS